MASILKVDKIRVTGSDSDSISFDGSGNITFNKTTSGSGINTVILANDTTGGTAAEIAFDLSMDTSYIYQKIIIESLYASALNDLYAQTRRASDNTYYTGSNSYAYAYRYTSRSSAGGSGSDGNTYARFSGNGMGNTSSRTSTYEIYIFNNAVSGTGRQTTLRWYRDGYDSAKYVHEGGSIAETATTTTNQFKIYSSAGGGNTLTYSGYVHYGIKRA